MDLFKYINGSGAEEPACDMSPLMEIAWLYTWS